MLGLVKNARKCKLCFIDALPDLGLGLMSLSLPGRLHKGLGEEGRHSALQD
jgi:hypothetical protein